MIAAVIMAGGSGERFWPKSRISLPKQCLKIVSEKTMIEETVDRLKIVFPFKHIFIATNHQLYEQISKVLPEVNYILEPMPKNTAACIGLSAIKLLGLNKEAIMFIETADHYYKDEKAYLEHIEKAIKLAKDNKIVLIGIKPTYPHTGLGYIQPAELYQDDKIKIYKINSFKEKPDLETAKKFVGEGYLWNSGMFVAKCSLMLEAIKQYMPKLHAALMKIQENSYNKEIMIEEFSKLESVPIDIGVMEKHPELYVLKAEMHWDDIGDWAAMERIHEKDADGNVVKGQFVGHNVKNSIILGDKLVAGIDLDSLIIVNTSEATLIMPKEKAQNIRKIIEKLKAKEEFKEYLK